MTTFTATPREIEPGRALSADDLAVILRALDKYADAVADDGRGRIGDTWRTDAEADAEVDAVRRVRTHLAPMLVQTPRHGIPLGLVRIDTDPHRRAEGRVQEYAYGGMDCCDDSPAYVVTRTNALGTGRMTVCVEHRAAALTDAPLYVDGWGTSTTTVERITA